MTEEMIANEKTFLKIFPHKRLEHLHNIHYRDSGKGIVTLVHASDADNSNENIINLDGGATSRHVSCTIMSDYDRQKARERIQKMKEEGTTVRQRLAKLKKHITLTSMTIDARHYHLDGHILEHGYEKKEYESNKKVEARRKKELEYVIKCYRADLAKARNPSPNAKEWRSFDDIKAYLQPLKKEKEENWPTNRTTMEGFYVQCFGRGRINLVLEEEVMNEWEQWRQKHASDDALSAKGKTNKKP